ncbi:unknown [Firmicutes bacterium CAG:176]|nr:unknown [Firmicutes bacterium CAG:176]
MDELEKTAQETAEETGGMAPDAGEQQVPDGEQGVPGGEEDFETLIRGRYKGEFDARVRRILDGRLRGLRQENERLREMAAAAETARQREQEAQLQAAMEFAVIRARQQMAQAIASGGSRVAENGGGRAGWRRTADGAGASAAGILRASAGRSWRRYGREYRMERRSDFRKGEKTWR